MVPSTHPAKMSDFPSHEAMETLWDDDEFVLSRRPRSDVSPALLILAPTSAHPSRASMLRLERAYSLRGELDRAWAVLPRELVNLDGRPCLLLDDPGGELLVRHVGHPWQLEPFLRLAISLSVAARQLHESGIVHKDIKPTHVLCNLATGDAWLTGFGIASRLPRERQAPSAPSEIAGTLAYMAPEQTGRMNRQVDSRSDLYALGITFYELLSGTMPFSASSPIEWIHSHIARPPPPLAPTIPEQLSAIVMKLLAKAADDRYQTAAGLEADLRRAWAAFRAHGKVERFQLAERDAPNKLVIPGRLYGRRAASDRLAAALERVTQGETELLMISGYSGIGKSALVDELHKELVPARGRLARGKFDQYKRDIPYATLAEALQSLVRQLLRESDIELERWRNALRAAVGKHGQLLVNLIPEFELLLGPQQAVPEVSLEEAKRRFQLLWQRVLSVLARPEHPLVLFLDDLQWVDRAMLDLLPHFLDGGVRHLLLIGAYRDNEVDGSHPLLRTLDEIRTATASVQEIVLGPLLVEQVGHLVADALHEEPERVEPLSRLVHEKTGGNPFFVIQFLLALRDDGLLTFDTVAAKWCWDLVRILGRGFTDNLADFMVGKLSQLPMATRQVLKQLACVGRKTAISTLSAISAKSEAEVHAAVWDAVQTGLVVSVEGSYEFPHDRVQEASHALSSESERSAIHLKIARHLTGLASGTERNDLLFEIVSHFNRAHSEVESPAERRQVAELNLLAAKRAKAAIAFDSASTYLAAGTRILAAGGDSWSTDASLAFALGLQRADCEYLTGQLTAAEGRLEELTTRAPSRSDQCAVTCLRAAVYLTLNRPDSSLAVCLEQLREFGIDWQPRPDDAVVEAEYRLLRSRIPDDAPERLADLPLMQDLEWRACMDVLLAMEPAAVFTDKGLHDLGVIRMANLSIEHGNCDASPLGYSELSMVLAPRFGDRELGFRFGQLGCELVERQGFLRFAGRVFVVAGYHVLPWTQPMASAQALMRRAYHIAVEGGDLTFICFSLVHLVQLGLAAGDPLEPLLKEAQSALAFARKAGFELIVQCLLGLIEVLESLRGAEPSVVVDRKTLDDPGLAIAACFYWVRRLQAEVLAGDQGAALEALAKAKPLMWTSPTFFELAEYHFFAALAEAGAGNREGTAAHYEVVQAWSRTSPASFKARALLIAAELARLDERVLDAQRLYEQAIADARINRLVHNEALAHELAARFHLAHDLTTAAQAHWAEARACYERWGALGMVRRLDPRQRPLGNPRASTSGAALQQLDLATVVEVSHAVSSEILLDRLVERLMVIAVEHAGAGRALLLLPTRDGHRIEAEALAQANEVKVRFRQTPISSQELPESVVRYVLRAQDSVIVDDASEPNPFASDDYLKRAGVRSVLCLPLVKQGLLTGALYLENGLTPHVFTPDRIAVLRLLASQAAISLENARLFAELRQAELNLSAAQRLSHTGSFRWAIATGDVAWSEETAHIFGFDPRQPANEAMIFERFHPDERARASDEVRNRLREGKDWQAERRLLMADGSVKYVFIAAHPVQGDTGGLELVGAVMDITSAKRSEEKLRATRQRYAVTLSSIGDGVIATDVQACISYMNPVAETLTGWSQADGLGRRLEEVYCVAKEGDQTTLSDRDGGQIPVDERRAPIIDDGDTHGIVLVFRDVTERRRAEEAEALRLARDVAEAANKAKDDFLANVSHEIRTPMNAIVGMTELILDTPLSNEQRQWLATVKSASDNLLVIIDDLLDFSKIEAGKLELSTGPFSVREELAEIVRTLGLRAQRKGLDLFSTVSDDVPERLLGDAGRLRQILLNLVGNAIKFTEQGQVVVKVCVAERPVGEADVALRFTVRDTGIGISANKQAVIFQAFAQEDTSTTRRYGGTGLGLTIASRLATLLGGAISVTSEPGRGSSFELTARFARVAVATDEPPALVPPTRAEGSEQRSLSVLIAEDNEFNTLVLRQLLERRGHEVQVAASGDQALARVQAGYFDVMLLDLHMPGLDGFEVLERLRQLERHRDEHLPVIVLSARSRQEDRERCLAAGVDEFLAKPLQPSALWSAISRVVPSERATSQQLLLDPAALLAATDNDPELLGQLWTALHAHLPTELSRLAVGLEQRSAATVREAARRLYGMTAAASTSAARAALELEELAEQNRLADTEPVVARLQRMGQVLMATDTPTVHQVVDRWHQAQLTCSTILPG